METAGFFTPLGTVPGTLSDVAPVVVGEDEERVLQHTLGAQLAHDAPDCVIKSSQDAAINPTMREIRWDVLGALRPQTTWWQLERCMNSLTGKVQEQGLVVCTSVGFSVRFGMGLDDADCGVCEYRCAVVAG